MMTISRLSAGDGYDYYIQCTARGDHPSKDGQELGDYYLETGTPDGVWMGRGAAALGIEGAVTEQQMKALFGEGLHPDADRMIADLIAAGMDPKKAIEHVRLGRKFAAYQVPDSALKQAIQAAIEQREQQLGRELTADERMQVRMRTAATAFRDQHGRSASRIELAKWMSQELSSKQNTVAGFDLTFSAPKSVSVAWGVGDERLAGALEAAHEQAIAEAIEWLEDEVIRARTGAQGIAFHRTHGLLATRFRHWESREGDPQLHDHVVIANRVAITDERGRERWLSIDSRSLYKATVAASSVYNQALANALKQQGLELRERTTSSGRYEGMELAAIDDATIEKCSARSAAIDTRTADLVAGYVTQHGRQPDVKTMLKLRQQATLETRVPKSQAATRDQLRQRWQTHLGGQARQLQQELHRQLDTPQHGRDQMPAELPDLRQVAQEIVAELSSRQSTWNRNHVETRVNMWAQAQPGIVSPEQRQQLTQLVLRDASIGITPQPRIPSHPELLDRDGASIYAPPAAQLYTSAAVLAAEDLLVDAAHDIHLPAVTTEHIDAAISAADRTPDDGQIALAKQVAGSEKALTVGVGPAGAGKTTALKLAVTAIANAGVAAHGITVSAAAADQLQQATGMASTTIAKWLHELDAGRLQIAAGDVIIVDEAGMASTTDLARITTTARDAGAFVRLVGDDRQLQAIGAGGALRMLRAEADVVHLEQLHRFANQEEAAASLAVRDNGDVEWYISQGRVHGGRADEVYQQLVDTWRADVQAGRDTLMMATTNASVDALNLLAQQSKIDAGEVDLARPVMLADGHHAGVGDRILTRRNDRRLSTGSGHSFVKNGDLWTITSVNSDGSVGVVDAQGRGCVLPAAYVAASTSLGYASTVHRAQGRSVDVAHLLLEGTATTREALYVGLTRGADSNVVWAVTDGRTAPDMLRDAAGRDGVATSARELMAHAQAEAEHPAHLVRILADMQRRADLHRYDTIIRRETPALWDRLKDADLTRLYAAIADAEDVGFSARRILSETSQDLPDGAETPAGLIAWRIRRHLRIAHQRATQPTAERPFQHLSDLELAAQLHAATLDKTTTLEQVRHTKQTHRETEIRSSILKDGSEVAAWQHRVYGNLDDYELASRLRSARQRSDAASASITEIRRQARQLLRNPDAPAAPQLLAEMDARLTQLRTDRDTHLRMVVQLKDETRTRADLDGRSWWRETMQREAQTVPQRPGDIGDVDQAELAFVTAREIRRQLWIESQHRRYEPEQGVVERRGAPAWAVSGRGAYDDATPTSWQPVLAEMRGQVADAITGRGAALALQPPAWATTYLGPVPDHTDPRRQRWEQVAGQIETWRGLTDHTDPARALPAASRSKAVGPHATTWLHTLQAAASDLRLGRPITEPHQPPTPDGGDEPGTPPPIPALAAARPTPAGPGLHRTEPAAAPQPTPAPVRLPAAIPIAEPQPVISERVDETPGNTTRARIIELNQQAADFYRSQYLGSGAAEYLARRLGTDLTDQPSVVVGYAPGRNALLKHLTQHGATAQELIDAGLAKQGIYGLTDVFRDRLVFGLHDAVTGDLVGFVGRAAPNADPRAPKYLNTPATTAFTKGEVLFGLHEHQALITDGADLVRVEGPMDALAITLGTQGKAVGVAPLGTALTTQQAQLIAAQHRRVWEATDTDKAGQAAAAKDHERFIAAGVVAHQFDLLSPDPSNPVKDPAELLQQVGGAERLQMPLALGDSAPTLPGRLLVNLVHRHHDRLADGNLYTRVAVAREAAQLIAALPAEQQHFHARLVVDALHDINPTRPRDGLEELLTGELRLAQRRHHAATRMPASRRRVRQHATPTTTAPAVPQRPQPTTTPPEPQQQPAHRNAAKLRRLNLQLHDSAQRTRDLAERVQLRREIARLQAARQQLITNRPPDVSINQRLQEHVNLGHRIEHLEAQIQQLAKPRTQRLVEQSRQVQRAAATARIDRQITELKKQGPRIEAIRKIAQLKAQQRGLEPSTKPTKHRDRDVRER